MMKGFVNIFKPLRMTSSDVVIKVRGILRQALGEKQKTGHLGTLDPLACGVLPIAIGNATRLFDYTLSKTKTYIATFKFGVTTDTLDRDGKITETCDKPISKTELLSVIPKLIGEIDQIPPQYSAKSIDGRRAYDIARNGGFVELTPKKVYIYDIELLDNCSQIATIANFINNIHVETRFDYDKRYKDLFSSLTDNEFAFKITCGGGTYIRSIVRDMAQAMGTVGYMSSLCRTQSGDFNIENAVTIEEFEKNPLKFVNPIDVSLKSYGIIDLDEISGHKALNGIKINYVAPENQIFVIKICGETVGLGEVCDGKLTIKTRL